MRFFIALEIPEESKHELKVVQEQLKQLIPEIRLTDNDKLHLTIAFVGDQDDNLIEPLIETMTAAAAPISPFEVTPGYIDGFPHFHTAHILWVGVKGDIDQLYMLRHHIKDGLQKLNLEVDERRYVPHIAIAKVPPQIEINEEIEQGIEKIMQKPFTPIQISSIKLFQSIPDHGFHQHNTLVAIPLMKNQTILSKP